MPLDLCPIDLLANPKQSLTCQVHLAQCLEHNNQLKKYLLSEYTIFITPAPCHSYSALHPLLPFSVVTPVECIIQAFSLHGQWLQATGDWQMERETHQEPLPTPLSFCTLLPVWLSSPTTTALMRWFFHGTSSHWVSETLFPPCNPLGLRLTTVSYIIISWLFPHPFQFIQLCPHLSKSFCVCQFGLLYNKTS